MLEKVVQGPHEEAVDNMRLGMRMQHAVARWWARQLQASLLHSNAMQLLECGQLASHGWELLALPENSLIGRWGRHVLWRRRRTWNISPAASISMLDRMPSHWRAGALG
jgi:hypothetical protein